MINLLFNETWNELDSLYEDTGNNASVLEHIIKQLLIKRLPQNLTLFTDGSQKRFGRHPVDIYMTLNNEAGEPIKNIIIQYDGWRFHSSTESYVSDQDADRLVLNDELNYLLRLRERNTYAWEDQSYAIQDPEREQVAYLSFNSVSGSYKRINRDMNFENYKEILSAISNFINVDFINDTITADEINDATFTGERLRSNIQILWQKLNGRTARGANTINQYTTPNNFWNSKPLKNKFNITLSVDENILISGLDGNQPVDYRKIKQIVNQEVIKFKKSDLTEYNIMFSYDTKTEQNCQALLTFKK